jgi:hypothetical protein
MRLCGCSAVGQKWVGDGRKQSLSASKDYAPWQLKTLSLPLMRLQASVLRCRAARRETWCFLGDSSLENAGKEAPSVYVERHGTEVMQLLKQVLRDLAIFSSQEPTLRAAILL